MELKEVKERIWEIKREADGNELAHQLEDSLWEDVLVAIGDGVDNPKQLAKECLKTLDIKFDRWYA